MRTLAQVYRTAVLAFVTSISIDPAGAGTVTIVEAPKSAADIKRYKELRAEYLERVRLYEGIQSCMGQRLIYYGRFIGSLGLTKHRYNDNDYEKITYDRFEYLRSNIHSKEGQDNFKEDVTRNREKARNEVWILDEKKRLTACSKILDYTQSRYPEILNEAEYPIYMPNGRLLGMWRP